MNNIYLYQYENSNKTFYTNANPTALKVYTEMNPQQQWDKFKCVGVFKFKKIKAL